MGRFGTADPSTGSDPSEPATWNKYGYVVGDPVNLVDRSGLWYSQAGGSGEEDQDQPILGPNYFGPQTPASQPKKAPTSPPPLHVRNVSKTGAHYDTAAQRFRDIAAEIDPKCADFLNSGGNDVKSYINDLLASDLLAVADFTGAIAAFTNSTGTDMPDGTAAIVVNNGSAFFNSNFTVDSGKYSGGTAQAQVDILLHELGHALSAKGFQNDLNNKPAGQANDKLIDQNCAGTIGKFK